MAITDTQKVDFLWKKLGFGATKSDTNANKKAPNEAIASPLLLRGDKVWKQAGSIPAVQPGSSTGVVTVYPTSSPIECTLDGTATANRTWKTGQTDWIPPEIASTYQVKVYIHTSGDAAGATGGDQVFATGSGNDDEWYFDYQSGVLHFIGTNLPNGVSFTGKSVYIAGSRYTGTFGVGADASELGAFTFTDNRIQTTVTNEEIILEPAGTGYVAIDTTSGLIIPVGTTLQRPSAQTGMIRFNSTDGQVEVYNGSSWQGVGSTNSVTLDEFDGDGSTTAFTLSRTGTAASVWVAINGVTQEVTNTYTVSGTTLTFNEAPASGDKIQVRNFYSSNYVNVSTSIIQDADNDTKIQVEESADEDTIRLDTAGTERLTISSAGQIVAATGYTPGSDYALATKKYVDDNAGGGGSLSNIVEDTTPQLGGNLDAQSNNITSLGTINTHTIPGGTGTLALTSDLYTNSDVDSHLNQSNPTAGYVLSWNGSDYAWVAQTGGDVVDDTTPQLGGALDTNGNNITFGDNDEARFGAGSDLRIYHNGVHSYVDDLGTGNLYLRSNGAGIVLGSNLSSTFAEFNNGAEVALRYNGSTKIATTNTGIDVTGAITTDEVYETLTSKSSATGTVAHDLSTGHIFYHTSISANFTANFTNIDTTSNQATTVTLVLVQGATAYIPTAVQIGGSAATINWQGGSQPTGTNNGIDVVTFSILNVGGTYTVLGQLTDF